MVPLRVVDVAPVPASLLFPPTRRDAGDGSDHDAGRDQRVLADHVRRHSDVVARDQAHQQRSRRGSH
jgi:hypothetical protein